jgi:hypothetical protein
MALTQCQKTVTEDHPWRTTRLKEQVGAISCTFLAMVSNYPGVFSSLPEEPFFQPRGKSAITSAIR